MLAFRFAISLADSAFSASTSRFRHDSRSGTIPDAQSANAYEDQAMQTMTKIAAAAFPYMHSSLSSVRRQRFGGAYRRSAIEINQPCREIERHKTFKLASAD